MKTRPFLPALPFGLLTLILSLMMPDIPAAPGVRNPIVELEFARNADGVKQVLGVAGQEVAEPLSGPMVDAFFTNIRADRFFLLAYSSFLAVTCLLAWRQRRRPRFIFAAVLAVVAAVLDHLENGQLLAILETPEREWSVHLAALAAFTWGKWSSITLVFLILGWFWMNSDRLGRIIMVVSWFAAIAALLGAIFPGVALIFSLIIALLFLMLFVWEILYRLPQPV